MRTLQTADVSECVYHLSELSSVKFHIDFWVGQTVEVRDAWHILLYFILNSAQTAIYILQQQNDIFAKQKKSHPEYLRCV